MPEPFTLTIFATIAAKGLLSHGAVHGTVAIAHAATAKGTAIAAGHAATAKGTAIAAGHAATAKGTAIAAGHAAAGHVGSHLGPATLLATTIAASTVGGAMFLNVFNHTIDDIYEAVRRGFRRAPTRRELHDITQTIYRNTRLELSRKGILTHADDKDMRRIAFALAR
jgi:hypothetical protein